MWEGGGANPKNRDVQKKNNNENPQFHENLWVGVA